MAWDQDGYGKTPQNVYVYILSGIDGVGEIKERVTCDFKKNSFDLKIHGLNGKNYRLVKTNLDKDIIPSESKCVVKKNKITLSLRKVRRPSAAHAPRFLAATRCLCHPMPLPSFSPPSRAAC